jgi:hypothetical protein
MSISSSCLPAGDGGALAEGLAERHPMGARANVARLGLVWSAVAGTKVVHGGKKPSRPGTARGCVPQQVAAERIGPSCVKPGSFT